MNVAVLEGDQVKIVDEQASSLPDCPSLLASLIGFDSSSSWKHSVNLLVQLAVSMRAHGRGGLLLVVPAGTQAWLESMVQPIQYAVAPAFAQLAELSRRPAEGNGRRYWQDAVSNVVESIAGLTAVDGATVMTDRLRGAGLRRQDRQAQRIAAGRAGDDDRADRGGTASLVHPTSLAARGICRPRSSCTISATRWRWSHRRTGASPCSPGRRAKRWCTRIASKRCCCEVRLKADPTYSTCVQLDPPD